MSETKKVDTFKCEYCGEEFEKGWSDEEAMAEKNEKFSDVPMEDCAMVCDVCYHKLMGGVQ